MPVADPSPADVPRRIAFVSTRIAGHDGVSLEVEKWAAIVEGLGHECYYVAGECDRSPERSAIVPLAHFSHPEIEAITEACFDRHTRSAQTGARIHAAARSLKSDLGAALDGFGADLIVAENCLTIPMNIPLGLALVEIVMETGRACLAHHHDFVWERERYLVSAAEDHLAAAFPPALTQIMHVVINSKAAREFSRRTGLSCRVIPNVMDFDRPPPAPDGYGDDFRASLGLSADALVILQPTRVVQRKGIEHAIEAVHALADSRCVLVVTHASGDEGGAYAERIRRYAELLRVPLVFADPWMATRRGTHPDGGKLYTVRDAYAQADFVTYPSTYEGFGNAFLEAVYYRKPLLCNRYAIYRTDIEPCGFDVALMDGFVTDDVVARVRALLADPQARARMTDHNYEVGRQFFSYRRAAEELHALLAKPQISGAL